MEKPGMRPDTATFRRRVCFVVLFLIASIWLLKPSASIIHGYQDTPIQTESFDTTQNENNWPPNNQGSTTPGSQTTQAQSRVPLEAHIMSKCPDAQACLQKLVLPAMEQISDKVDFKLSFIASVSKYSEEIECPHGPGECIGDMLMLCAANLPFPATADKTLLPPQYPRTPIIRSLGFANCLLNNLAAIPDREVVHQCAMEHGIDFDALNKCASQQNDDPNNGDDGGPPLSGVALLRESALRGEELGIQISCTVRLDDAVWCVHDSGEWKDCVQDGQGGQPSVLVDQVEKLYKERN